MSKSKIVICSIKNCGRPHSAKGFCVHHYNISDAAREKERIRRNTEVGKKKQHLKNLKYGNSFKGNMTRRFNTKGLSESEKKKAEAAFRFFDGKCQCCGTTSPAGKGWHLDHKDEKFRGILCHYCNIAAGFLKDDPLICKKLIGYLEKDTDTSVVTLEQAVKLGGGALAHINHYVREAVKHAQPGVLQNYKTAVLNVPYLNCSEVGNELAKTHQVSLTYFERGDGIIQFSLRSIGDIDVSAIAQVFGGGGHRNASGFQKPFSEGRRLVDKILGRSADEYRSPFR